MDYMSGTLPYPTLPLWGPALPCDTGVLVSCAAFSSTPTLIYPTLIGACLAVRHRRAGQLRGLLLHPRQHACRVVVPGYKRALACPHIPVPDPTHALHSAQN